MSSARAPVRKVGVSSDADTYHYRWEWHMFLYAYLKQSEGNKSLVQHNGANSLI
jgi:hypothetical protein